MTDDDRHHRADDRSIAADLAVVATALRSASKRIADSILSEPPPTDDLDANLGQLDRLTRLKRERAGLPTETSGRQPIAETLSTSTLSKSLVLGILAAFVTALAACLVAAAAVLALCLEFQAWLASLLVAFSCLLLAGILALLGLRLIRTPPGDTPSSATPEAEHQPRP